MKKLFILLVCLLPVLAQAQMETSVAGFIPLSGSGRIVYNFNPGWRFHRGDIKGAEAVRFDDTSWQVVSAPHTVELMPAEASGCRNYQGVASVSYTHLIIAEQVSEDERARNQLRNLFSRQAVITSKVVKGKEEEAAKYRDYFDFSEPLKRRCV